jgi:hypothetical protein
MGLILYLVAALLGLIAGGYACLGLLILLAPQTQSETSLWFIFPSAIAGATIAMVMLRKLRNR